MSKVAACIVASEVLNGKTLDTNSNYLAKKCFEAGLNLHHIRVIPDDVAIISDTVRKLSSKYDAVFTSGGIGPTHDDMTYDSISKAFNRELVPHEPTIAAMKRHLNVPELNAPQIRMALIPKPDIVFFTPGLWVPLVQVKNVLILPGVPSLFHKMLDDWINNHLPNSGLTVTKRVRKQIKTLWKESQIADLLESHQKLVQSELIEIGSYPKMFPDGSTFVVVSLVGPATSEDRIMEIAEAIKGAVQGEDWEENSK